MVGTGVGVCVVGGGGVEVSAPDVGVEGGGVSEPGSGVSPGSGPNVGSGVGFTGVGVGVVWAGFVGVAVVPGSVNTGVGVAVAVAPASRGVGVAVGAPGREVEVAGGASVASLAALGEAAGVVARAACVGGSVGSGLLALSA